MPESFLPQRWALSSLWRPYRDRELRRSQHFSHTSQFQNRIRTKPANEQALPALGESGTDGCGNKTECSQENHTSSSEKIIAGDILSLVRRLLREQSAVTNRGSESQQPQRAEAMYGAALTSPTSHSCDDSSRLSQPVQIRLYPTYIASCTSNAELGGEAQVGTVTDRKVSIAIFLHCQSADLPV